MNRPPESYQKVEEVLHEVARVDRGALVSCIIDILDTLHPVDDPDIDWDSDTADTVLQSIKHRWPEMFDDEGYPMWTRYNVVPHTWRTYKYLQDRHE